MLSIREAILNEITNERLYQEEKWGNTTDDTVNTPNDFVSYIGAYSTKWFPGGFPPYTEETVANFRKSMMKVAALAVAAVESVDRQQAANGRTFYQEENELV
jgi:chaperone required for assembly of F1-ATPase